jgi:hypothetical protein
MSKTKAYTYFIGPHGTSTSEYNMVNQSSPTWVLSFVRWDVRDTLRAVSPTGQPATILGVRPALVVENDCIQLTTNSNKSVLTPSMSATFLETDVNYETAVAPGDFVFVNILNWEIDARNLANRARGQSISAINGIADGFKGVYKVQSVRKTIMTDPESGIKRVLIRIDAYAFTEFNNMIYYNPYLNRDNQGSDKDALLFVTNIHADYAKLINPDTNPRCQDLIKFLIQSFIGVGITDQGGTFAAGSPITANTHFYIPPQVGTYLGVKNAKSAKDVYNYLFGIQQYATQQNLQAQQGMNPSNISSVNNRFYYTTTSCGGTCLLKAEYWNQTNAWSIINQYTNAPLNELYTCFRLSPSGSVMPTVVFRQIPFTTDFFGTTAPFQINANVTRFSNVPRWKISSELIYSSDIGRDEAARINFVQYYVQPPSDIGKADGFIAAQTAAKNYVYDINDVTRSGLRPNVITTNFEDLTIQKDEYVSKRWALIVGDALVGGHLKMNGTIECVGIVDPIAVGDNLEFDDVVYHIEEVMHSCNIVPQTGVKTFRTTLKLSNGISVATTSTGIAYPEMQFTNAYHDRVNDYNNDQLMPGVSEEQDIAGRHGQIAPTTKIVNRPDAPFAQPGQIIKATTPDEDDE